MSLPTPTAADAARSIEVPRSALPPLPDDVLTNRSGGYTDPRGFFAHPERPLEIEIGSGKGTFLAQQSPAQPLTNFLGFEYEREFFMVGIDKLTRAGAANVRMMCLDAGDFVHWRVPDACCRVLHLYFPDPWPKAKHHRRRMVSDRFLGDAWRVLEPAGELRVVTDHAEYWAWMEEHFARWCTTDAGALGPADADGSPSVCFLRRAFAPPSNARMGEGELVGTNFERKYRREGRPFHATTLVKPA
ncbi:MAG: tRNA (guanosine(46)-N7)-methyltransferase TrmB [Phycisphaerales bacterium]